MQLNSLVAIVLAGNDEDPNILGGIGQRSKFFMPFDGELVGDRILRAIDGLERCAPIYLVAPRVGARKHTCSTRHLIHLVAQGETRTEGLISAVQEAQEQGHYKDDDYVLVITGDLPLLATSALERFLSLCQETEIADLYIGMVPLAAVPEMLRPAYEKDFLPFCGGLCLHTDVYLLRPGSVTQVGYKRFEEIVTIRRSNLRSFHGVLQVVLTLLRVVGLRGLLPLARIVTGLQGHARDGRPRAWSGPDAIERIALSLIEKRFSPRASLVPVSEPALALEFDCDEQLGLLVEYDSYERMLSVQIGRACQRRDDATI